MQLFSQFLHRSNDVVVVRILTNSNLSEHFLHRVTEFSLTDGIDNRVAYRAEKENALCHENRPGWNIDARNEFLTYTHTSGELRNGSLEICKGVV